VLVRSGSSRRPDGRSRRSPGSWGISTGTLANWVTMDRLASQPANGRVSESERQELLRLRRENVEVAMERDVLKRSVVGWVREATK
jgi:transposase